MPLNASRPWWALILMACVTTAWAQAPASAQGSSTKPVRWVVPYPPGGSTDLVARALAPKLSDALGQPVILDYRPGAGGNVGTESVARAAPDGNTIVLTTTALVTNPVLMKAPSVDPLKQLTPVMQLVSYSFVLLTHPATGPQSLAELDTFVRRGGVNCARAGGLTLLGCEWLREVTHSSMADIPYKGGTPALQDLIGGQVHFYFDMVNVALPHLRSGALRAVATTGLRRLPAVPDAPTLNERFPGFVMQGWFGILAPAGTPAPVVERLNAAFAKVLADPEIRRSFEAQDLTITATTAADFGRIIDHDQRKYMRLAQQVGLSPE